MLDGDWSSDVCSSDLDPQRPVYVEAESRKIGNLHLPETLIERIRRGQCVVIDASTDARVAFLLKDYDYFLTRPEFLIRRLDALSSQQSRETIQHWNELIHAGDWPTLVRELLERHYDPLYHRSQQSNFTGLPDSQVFTTDDLSPAGIHRLAQAIAQSQTAQMA
jgi:tRNA 2-selenouridine synthase